MPLGLPLSGNISASNAPIIPPLWTPGGPLIWSPVDIVQAAVTAGIGTHAIEDRGGPGGFNWGTAFYVTYAGRSCSGVKFRWGSGSPAVNVECTIWDNANVTDAGAKPDVGNGLIAVQAEGSYSFLFPVPIVLTPGFFYVVSAREVTGRYTCRLQVPLISANFQSTLRRFIGSNAEARTVAPGVLITAGCAGSNQNSLCSQIGGGGGAPINWLPNQSVADPSAIEPIII